MRTLLLVFAVLLVSPTIASADRAKQVRYIGIHPVAKSAGSGICYIEGPHVHLYAADKLQYREHDGHNVFVGDPVAYGYEGPRYTYKGHHPVHVHAVVGSDEPDVEYCYLDGPHYHAFAPPEGALTLEGGVYFYTGAPPKAYLEARPAMIKVNAVYEPLVYARPVVTVAAPVGWIGARVDLVAPVVVAPRAGVAVDARVHIPLPSVHVQIGGPAVIIHDRHHHHKHKKFKRHRGRGRW
jgi:hypothetical protein